ncbi:uncharacterized protein LOC114927928 [Nylanderia fulva]|uniref:uncharacterized protein LOC114927928 n=1 Tax=Nylanderia fulva TaxID=613905 RepID=UPI0010FBB0FE|nr:uncharacterized protein LOC114927928 [Nylanderia fulva]
MAGRLLQTNLNHCARAQDLFVQTLAEWNIGLAVAAEPYYVHPNRSGWLGDEDGQVAIVGQSLPGGPPLALKEKGEGYVAAEWGEIIIIGVYFSPNRDTDEFERFLESINRVLNRFNPKPILVMDDLNAKAVEWGSATSNAKGEILTQWRKEISIYVTEERYTHACGIMGVQ